MYDALGERAHKNSVSVKWLIDTLVPNYTCHLFMLKQIYRNGVPCLHWVGGFRGIGGWIRRLRYELVGK